MAHRQLAILLYAANYAAFTAKGLRLAPLWGGGSMGWRGAFILRENMPPLFHASTDLLLHCYCWGRLYSVHLTF